MEVIYIGTGFMMIPRRTFEKFEKAYLEKIYNISDTRKACAFFDCAIDPDTKFYMPEDYLFCQHVQKMGGKVWLAPHLKLSHQGMYSFKGSLDCIASAMIKGNCLREKD